jgi:DNA-binding NarL/FixJ family response regulator
MMTLVETNKPLHIYFKDEKNDNTTIELLEEIGSGIPCRFRLCKSWSELSSAISESPASIMFNIDMVNKHSGTVSEFMMMLETLIKYTDIKVKPNIGVSIESTTPISTIKQLQKNKIMALIPSAGTLGISEYRLAIRAVLEFKPYWPKHIISKLPGGEPKPSQKDVQLTSRQREVFDLIANRGLSNKQIAKVLKISESTVKIHVSAILKNLCVRNRTQLALTKL